MTKYVHPLASYFFTHIKVFVSATQVLSLFLIYFYIAKPHIYDISIKNILLILTITFSTLIVALNFHRRFYILSLALTMLSFNTVLAVYLSIEFSKVQIFPEVVSYILFALILLLIIVPITLTSYSFEHELMFAQSFALLSLSLLFSNELPYIFVIVLITASGIIVFSTNFERVFSYYIKYVRLLVTYIIFITALNYLMIFFSPLEKPLIDLQPLKNVIVVHFFYPGFDANVIIILLTLATIFMLFLRKHGGKLFTGNYLLNTASLISVNTVFIIAYFFIYLITLRFLGLSFIFNDFSFLLFLTAIAIISVFTYLPYFAYSEASLLRTIRSKLYDEVSRAKTKIEEYMSIIELLAENDDKFKELAKGYIQVIHKASNNLDSYLSLIRRINIFNYSALSEEVLSYLRNLRKLFAEFDNYLIKYLDSILLKVFYIIRTLCDITNIDIKTETQYLQDIPDASSLKIAYLSIGNLIRIINKKLKIIKSLLIKTPLIVSEVGIRYKPPDIEKMKLVQAIDYVYDDLTKLVNELRKTIGKYHEEFAKSHKILEEYVEKVKDLLTTLSPSDIRKFKDITMKIKSARVSHPSIRDLLINAKTLSEVIESLFNKIKMEKAQIEKILREMNEVPKDILETIDRWIKDVEESITKVQKERTSMLGYIILIPALMRKILGVYIQLISIRESIRVISFLIPAVKNLLKQKKSVDINDIPLLEDIQRYVFFMISKIIPNVKLTSNEKGLPKLIKVGE